jgi:hypothetical protein
VKLVCNAVMRSRWAVTLCYSADAYQIFLVPGCLCLEGCPLFKVKAVDASETLNYLPTARCHITKAILTRII